MEGNKPVKSDPFPRNIGPRIFLNKDRISFNDPAINALGNPVYVQALVNDIFGILIIAPAPISVAKTGKVCDCTCIEGGRLKMNMLFRYGKYIDGVEVLIERIKERYDWPRRKNYTYMLEGESISYNKAPALRFSLKDYIVDISFMKK